MTCIEEHFSHVIAYGEPLVRQERNPHDLWKDLDVERNGMILTDDFCGALRSIPLAGSTYHECFAEIADGLQQAWSVRLNWTDSQKQWRSKMIEGMGIWHNVFDRLGAGSKRTDPRIKHSQPFAFGTESIPQHDELVKMTDVGSSRK